MAQPTVENTPQQTPEEIAAEKKAVNKHLYSLLFRGWEPKLAMLPSIITGLGSMIVFFIIGKVLNELGKYILTNEQHKLDPSVEIYDPLDQILIYVWILVGFGAAIGIARFFDIFMWLRIGSRLATELRDEVFSVLMKSEITFFDTTSVGSVIKILLEDVQNIQESFGVIKGNQVASVAQFLVGIILAFVYSWKLTLIFMAVVPLMMLSMSLIGPMIGKNAIPLAMLSGKMTTMQDEILSSMKTIRSYNGEDYASEKLDEIAKEAAKPDKKIGYIIGISMGVTILISWGSVSGILYYGGVLIEQGEKIGDSSFKIGDLISFFGFIMFGFSGIMMVQGSLAQEQRAFDAGKRVLSFLNNVPGVPFEGGIEPEEFHGKIEFKDVSFKYPTRDQLVLKNVNFTVEPNECVALVGHSGSGKSTCIQLIERFYDVTEGQILIDDHDIKEYNPRWLHKKIGLVSQEPTLFLSSVENNIKYGTNDATHEMVVQAATTANAKDFIENFEKKYETLVGEKGSSLSGGQRQRIAIARAIIKNPTILLTDEATSALDSNSEREVQLALDQVMSGRTSIIVAHRLSTIKNAKRIYVFESGEVVENGTHKELVEKKGVYYKLVSKQLKKKDAGIKDDNEEEKSESSSSSSSSSSKSKSKSDSKSSKSDSHSKSSKSETKSDE